VPASWKVVSRVTGLGGIQDIRAAQGHAAIDPELVIEGMLIAGGFAVSSEMAEEEQEWLSAVKEQQAAAETGSEKVAEVESPAVTEAIEAATSDGGTSEEMAPAT